MCVQCVVCVRKCELSVKTNAHVHNTVGAIFIVLIESMRDLFQL